MPKTYTSSRFGPHMADMRLGFTLTEMAIVLGVIGIIIAGIFAAASVARYKVEFNQGSDEVGLIAGNMRSLYSGQNAAGAFAQAATAGFEAQLFTQGVFPSEMACLIAGDPNTYACHPWDQSTPSGSAQIAVLAAVPGTSPSEFILRYFNVPSDVCADLLVKDSLPGPDTGLRAINIAGFANNTYSYTPGGATSQLPVTPTNAAAACAGNGTYTITWIYTLGGQP